ncbi:MAG: N-(5'-phosphoribosyl)anthranilate isomerase [Phycisphaerae bacterium]|nr:MAG: N-(5'-phosphoribosyl)anthranilate isomerase [Phycisphaerae bacterium]
MSRVRTKLCGIMTVEDALAAVEAGADAIGMILHAQARRRIEPELAREIVQALPPYVTPVGVFVNALPARVLEIAQLVRLTTVQFHGNETIEDIRSVDPLKVIKAVRTDPHTVRDVLLELKETSCKNLCGILLETAVPGSTGGTGVANDFDLIELLRTEGAFEGLPPVIVSGGLTPQNVGKVVRRIRPYGVDVSSGIETEFGKKSPEKMRDFVKQAMSGCHG